MKADGNRCGAWAVANGGGRCAIHAGLVDPVALGRKGGQARERSVTGVRAAFEAADDSLRALARKQLEQLLQDENPQIRMRAAAALFSYSAERPPAEQQGPEIPTWFLRELEKAGLARVDIANGVVSYALLDVQKGEAPRRPASTARGSSPSPTGASA